jgi:hypothetical protein
MESLTRLDVFRFLVQHQCARAAGGMWLDLFVRLLERSDSKPSGPAGEGPDDAAVIMLELEQMFEWLTALAFHHNRPPAEAIGVEVIAVGASVRRDITHECINLMCQRVPIGEWPPGYRELLMKLWGDGFGNLLSRTIREVRNELCA